MAHLIVVANPEHNPKGDFGLDATSRLHAYPDSPWSSSLHGATFSGIGVYRSRLLTDWRAVIGDKAGMDKMPPRFGLTPLLRAAMVRGEVTGELHDGAWTDVGTPQRLAELDARSRGSSAIRPHGCR